jgi:hypothetical protein
MRHRIRIKNCFEILDKDPNLNIEKMDPQPCFKFDSLLGLWQSLLGQKRGISYLDISEDRVVCSMWVSNYTSGG